MKNPTPPLYGTKIDEYITMHSGFEEHRDYLSMSHLSECPRKIVREMREGFTVEEHTHRMAYAGYEHERNVIFMLHEMGLIDRVNVEVVAPFDSRLRGHLDGIWGNVVIEIKSLSHKNFEKMIQKDKNRALWKHFVQVQMYMRYSGLKEAVVIYRDRETYEHHVIGVPFIERQAFMFEEKAKRILGHLDADELPKCECGMCKE